MRIQRMPKKSSFRRKLTRHEQRDLDIEIAFMEGVVRRDPRYVEALQILGDDYTRRGRFDDGLKVDERLAQLRPDDSLVLYNLACSYSLTAQVDEAVVALERALKMGYRDFKWLAEDPDLQNVRRHPAFQKIRAKLRTMQIKVR
jgi:tetratricopeptide (TPR) repeat protein